MAPKRKPKKALIQFAVAGVIALAIGGFAIFLTFSLITDATDAANKQAQEAERIAEQAKREAEELRRRKMVKKKEEHREVQAVLDISPGEPITKSMITLVETDARPSPTVVTRLSEAVGKTAVAPILAGETLSRKKIASGDGRLQVSQGDRAITISVDNVGSLAGALMPGVYVDVLTTLTQDSTAFTKTLLQKVQVIAVDNGSGRSGNSVTLAVSPKEAEILTLAQTVGKFHLTLRNFKDVESAAVRGADVDYLLNDGKEPPNAIVNLPEPPSLEDGLIPVNLNGSGLPEPDMSGYNSEPTRSMEILKGSGAERVEFGN